MKQTSISPADKNRLTTEQWLQQLTTSPAGLSSAEAGKRLAQYGPNQLTSGHRSPWGKLFLYQFSSPITLMLIGSAILSLLLGEHVDALLILSIVLISAVLGYWQEQQAADALASLLATVTLKSTVLRDGQLQEIPTEEIVPGDVIELAAGSMVPGDSRLLSTRDLFVNEAALTGETFPVEKRPLSTPAEAVTSQTQDAVFYGTHVVSGTARAVVIQTARHTQYGQIAQRLELRPAETEFNRGVRRLGYFLMEVTFLLILLIFAANVFLHRPVLESFLFSLALAVGLTPQLLPAIISVNLAHGARMMAAQKVIVRRLAAIENFGSMNVLCSDKTGTLTEGLVKIHSAIDVTGAASNRVLQLAFINASFESGFTNPIDEAIREQQGMDLSSCVKLDEIPYDFSRKRLSILVREAAGECLLITKGALLPLLECCQTAELSSNEVVELRQVRESLLARYTQLSEQGFRLLGIAYRKLAMQAEVHQSDESQMVLSGMLVLHDPVKPHVNGTICRLRELGISLKMVTGDNQHVAGHVAAEVGLDRDKLLTGADLELMSDAALMQQAEQIEVFAEIQPFQKERILRALKKSGQVTGYLGDGINDVAALQAADVGISVDEAVDVAKDAADIVLLEHDLQILLQGVEAGRTTFANTLKYVYMATSANFGNMFSMAGASLLIPFLPLLPKQILLLNLLADFPEMTIARDHVDPEATALPRRWDVKQIRRFMLTFGPLSSLFDFATFAVLLSIPQLSISEFRSGWFLESIVSACVVVLVIRSRRPFWKSRPSPWLLATTLLVIVVAFWLPYTPLGPPLGLVPLPGQIVLVLAGIVAAYAAAAEVAKRWF